MNQPTSLPMWKWAVSHWLTTYHKINGYVVNGHFCNEPWISVLKKIRIQICQAKCLANRYLQLVI